MKGLIRSMLKTIARVATATSLVTILTCLLILGMIGVCWVLTPAPSYADNRSAQNVETITLDPWNDARAYVFDSKGHTFIVVACIKGGMSIIHHPACACFTQESAKTKAAILETVRLEGQVANPK